MLLGVQIVDIGATWRVDGKKRCFPSAKEFSLRRRPPGGGGHLGIFGLVCAAREKKKLIPRSRIRPKTDTPF